MFQNISLSLFSPKPHAMDMNELLLYRPKIQFYSGYTVMHQNKTPYWYQNKTPFRLENRRFDIF